MEAKAKAQGKTSGELAPQNGIKAAFRRARRRAMSLRKEDQGSTAIEFGLIAIPFFLLLFGILELALIFFIGSTLSQGVTAAGRDVRTGNFVGCGTEDAFRDHVCDKMNGLAGCERNLRIDILKASTFGEITLPDAGDGGTKGQEPDKDGNLPPVQNGVWTDTNPGDPVVVRGTFYYRLAMPPAFSRLESIKGTGRHIIQATTAFRVEPYGTNGSCAKA